MSALLAMAENHAIQDTLRAEIEELYLRSDNPTSREIDGLDYLENFVKEALRRYTPGMILLAACCAKHSC